MNVVTSSLNDVALVIPAKAGIHLFLPSRFLDKLGMTNDSLNDI